MSNMDIVMMILYVPAIVFFIIHIIYFGRSGTTDVLIRQKRYLAYYFSIMILLPLGWKFHDDMLIRKYKRISNYFLYASYSCLVIAWIMQLFIRK